jgi:hypothetical protein
MASRGFLFAILSLSVWAQAPDTRCAALKDALGLSDSQLRQLQQKSPAEIANQRPMSTDSRGAIRLFPDNVVGIPGGNGRRPFPHEQDPINYGLLDDSQKTKLQEVVAKIWRHPPTARLAIAIELTSAYQWPRFPCPHEIRGNAESDIDLTSFQLLQLQELHQSAGESPRLIAEKENRRTMLLHSGRGADSQEVIQLDWDIAALREQASRRRDLALAVLDDSQKVKLAVVEAALQLLSEARELRLIACLGCGEVLCQ